MEQPAVTLTMNQCDGCARGLPVVNGIHKGIGWDAICCTKNRYQQPEDWPKPERIEIIAHNGNDGLHYEAQENSSYER